MEIFFISSGVRLLVNDINIGTAPIGFNTDTNDEIRANKDILQNYNFI
jgi:hypothetical protein